MPLPRLIHLRVPERRIKVKCDDLRHCVLNSNQEGRERELGTCSIYYFRTFSQCTQAVPAADILGPADRERAGLLDRRVNADAPETASNARPLRASIHPWERPFLSHGLRPCQKVFDLFQWRRSAALKRWPVSTRQSTLMRGLSGGAMSVRVEQLARRYCAA